MYNEKMLQTGPSCLWPRPSTFSQWSHVTSSWCMQVCTEKVCIVQIAQNLYSTQKIVKTTPELEGKQEAGSLHTACVPSNRKQWKI